MASYREGYRSLVLKTLAVTPSGALSPGMLSASTVAVGASMGAYGGLLVALGHTLFELPYVLLLAVFLERIVGYVERVKKYLAVAVFAFLLYFSYLLVETAIPLLYAATDQPAQPLGGSSVNAFTALVAGLVFTGANPYFLLWWATIGLPLVIEAVRLGRRGVAVMYVSHVWMDYAWLALLAGGGGAATLLGPRPYAILLTALAAILVFFGVDVLRRSLR